MKKEIARLLNVILTVIVLIVSGVVSSGILTVVVALYLVGYKFVLKGKAPYFQVFK